MSFLISYMIYFVLLAALQADSSSLEGDFQREMTLGLKRGALQKLLLVVTKREREDIAIGNPKFEFLSCV